MPSTMRSGPLRKERGLSSPLADRNVRAAAFSATVSGVSIGAAWGRSEDDYALLRDGNVEPLEDRFDRNAGEGGRPSDKSSSGNAATICVTRFASWLRSSLAGSSMTISNT